jgi:hypothetical protein
MKAAGLRVFMPLSAAVLLCGCSAVGGISGGVAAIASGSATGNPGVGVAIGIGVKAAVDTSLKALSRRAANEDQTRLATAIGAMSVGETQSWHSDHFFSFNDVYGTVTLVRMFETPLAACREALFTADTGKAPSPDAPSFVARVCQGDNGWRWAEADPAVTRWGALQ